MEEVVATIFLRRLNSLLCEESEIFGGLEDEILLLKSQLSHLNSHIQPFQSELVQIGYFRTEDEEDGATEDEETIHDADDCIELEESIYNWLVRFRETIHDADDCIDLFIIWMNNKYKHGLDDSDQIVAAALLGCELRIINECLVEILDAKSQLDTSIASLSIEHSAIIDDEGENSFINKFITLPIDLKSCFMYTYFYRQNWFINKVKFVEILMAEGLIEEIPGGERMEDIVEGNINKLIELGMVIVSDHERFYFCRCDAVREEYLYWENIHISRTLFISNPLEMKLYNCKLLRVLKLDCYESNIIIEEVGNLIHLRYLDLEFQNLEKLPESIGNLRNLRTLNIDSLELKKYQVEF